MLKFTSVLLVSTAILTVTISATAMAQTAENECSFSQFEPGYLAPGDSVLPTKLASFSHAGGTPGKVTVSCNQSFNLNVSPPRQTTGVTFTPISSIATVETSTGESTNSNQASPLSLSAGTTPLTINISVDKASPITAGDYAFSVVLTIIAP
jgi:hypothetical protein